MYKLMFLGVLIVILVSLIPVTINADSSDNITLITKVVGSGDNITLITKVIGDNVTIHLITKVIDDDSHHSYVYWWGCCGDDWGEENNVPRSTPLFWLSMFPNMITGIISPDLACGDVRAEILQIEPSSVTIGVPVDVVFVVESSCNYVGNINLLLNGQNNQTLGVDLTNLYNKTYRTTIVTSGLQPGRQNVLILGSTSSFNVAGNVVPTFIEPPQAVAQTIPVEKTEDKIFMWVAIAIGGIIIVTIILLIVLR